MTTLGVVSQLCDAQSMGFSDDDVARRTLTADRLDSLAETADLMGDPASATRFREQASTLRMEAMRLLDE